MHTRNRKPVQKAVAVANPNTDYLQLPALPQTQSAWAYFAAHRPREVRRTIQMKFHRPSWGKVDEMLWAHTQGTNLRSEILSLLGPYYAIVCIHQMHRLRAEGSTSNRTQILGEIIGSCFRPPRRKLYRLLLREQPFLSLWLASEEHLKTLATVVALLDLAATERLKEHYAKKKEKALKFLRALWPASKEYLSEFAAMVTLQTLAGAEPLDPLSTPPIRVLYLREKYPICPALFAGACRESARDLLGWYNRLIGANPADLDDDDLADEDGLKAEALDTRTPEDVYASWLVAMEPYKRAAKTVIPFGPDEGMTFEQVGPRGVRWLQTRMTTREAIEETLVHIEVHLNPERYTPDELRRAQHARHPWKTKVSSERAPRASRFAQHTFDSHQPRVRLSALEPQALIRLRDEQFENLQYVDEFPALKESAELFFSGRGLKYPEITPVLNAEEQAQHYRQLASHLEWCRDPFPRGRKDSADFCAEDLEAVETTHKYEIEHHARALREPRLQPLVFYRSMRPPVKGSDDSGIKPAFTLLYRKYDPSDAELDRRYRYLPQSQRQMKIQEARERGPTYEYVLAVVIHAPAALSAPYNRRRFVPQLTEDFYYVDYPATRFVPPVGDDISLMIFPLECGWGSDSAPQPHSDQLLRKVIEERLAVQRRLYEQQEGHQWPLEQCLPSKGALGFAQITCTRNQQGKYEFFVKIPLPRPVPEAQLPERVIGFHEHEEGYSYAVSGTDGAVIETGDLMIPSHVQPKAHEWYPRNYVYEVRKAMVALAVKHNAHIGIEDTSDAKEQPSLSRAQNQRRFRRPSRTIISELASAALLAGLLKPLEIRGVPSRSCGTCGTKLHSVSKTIVHRVTSTCPSCASPHLINQHDDHRRLVCMACGLAWRSSEPWFICDGCHHQRAPAHNQATVVARLTLRRLVQFHEAAMKRDAERKVKREGSRTTNISGS
ncbi:hypothetical protein K2Z83_03140 [Oscillochloris sp. ZM17-4]|uniref:hypothetical protein n=1 Tax=Oscillochloris sp. ZM17-4 TaxID=2866714 RepID=UPI001C72BA35|nr:hypothetical protein [Oscillochloris sp. ZM17-4]MBX0326677.1 hypothetical protein [Oscillochloris sp. ZM17-4]